MVTKLGIEAAAGGSCSVLAKINMVTKRIILFQGT